ncbi:PREDICTED: probable crossover junction endonuclease EME2 isoform X2 [Capra hircus]|uniref:probable crossover junction endonuclease EME2 isoform X2 n=1 Tax=Capra hircus TaxID=9925 RepID=UPI0008465AB8|nr:PREDICTED: probable crossover junction endonuclease EME2 isoform X2 [Capra hircus]
MAREASSVRPEDPAAAAPGAGSGGCPPQMSPGAAGSGEGAGRAMARAGLGRAGGVRRGPGPRRPPTWEISDSDAEGPAGAETPARARDPAGERRPAAEALRRLRPGQAVRRLAVLVDPAVLEDAGADTLMEALHALGCEPRAEPQRPARSLRWSRASPDPCPRGVPPEVWAEDEPHVLRLLEPEEFVRGVVQLTQTFLWEAQGWFSGEQAGRRSPPRPSQHRGLLLGLAPLLPASWRWPVDPACRSPEEQVSLLGLQVCGPTCSMPWVTPESPGCLHLAVIGLDTYLWSQQPTAQETQQPEHLAVTCTEAAVGWPEVEEALVHLQLWANVDVLLVASWQELSQHVCAFTKALAQRPFKQARESGAFPFCTSGRWTAGERVARDGMGLRGAWWRQVRQFNRVSPAVADAVVSAFPSPRLLQQAYEACGTEQERLALLADLPVKTGKRAPPRRVGPDLSRRICLFLTTTDPDLLLDLGS